ncbi:MAG: hypothetical protein FJ257_02115 [Phycisphaerae bacterium]|nr:hypothetical protein [Phycisphaerae bacterium]
MRTRLAILAVLVLASAISSPTSAVASTLQPPAALRSARGVMGSVEIDRASPLRARPVRDATSGVLVRVVPLEDGRQRIEWLGLLEGSFDLAGLLEQVDGRPAADLPPLLVEVYSQLPPGSGTDLFGGASWRLDLSAGHRAMLAAILLAWIAVPVVVVVRRRLRRPTSPPPAPAPRPPTLAERLHDAVKDAAGRELSAAEEGRLELLLLRLLREHSGGGGSIAEATARLREDPATARVVRAVETWLHARGRGDREAAIAAIADAAAAERSAASEPAAGGGVR